jgi:capsular polysaccharide biosynthesis protein
MNLNEDSAPDQADITLEELLQALKDARWFIVAFVVVVTIAAGLIGRALPATYVARAVIAPVSNSAESSQMSGLAGLATQFGGIASLAGLSLSGDSKKWESIAVLESEALTEKYISQNNLLPLLYAKEWDPYRQTWMESDPAGLPTLWKANQFFAKKVRSVTIDNKTGLVTLAISWRDAATAAKWANDLIGLVNEYLRTKAIEQSERNIAYLNEQAAKTEAVGIKQAIYSLLQSEINREMLARGNEEYAFKVIDPARAPEKPASLATWMWMAAAFVASLVLSVVVVFFRASWQR